MAKENKTEHATPRKLQKAREKGQIARSKEVPSAAVLLGGLIILSYMGPKLMDALGAEMRDVLRLHLPAELSVLYVSGLMHVAMLRLGMMVGIVMLGVMMLSVIANVGQAGLAVSWEALRWKPEKLNPKTGLSKIFSKNGVIEVVKGLALLLVVSVVSYQVLKEHIPLYPRLVLMDVRQLLYWTSLICFKVFIRVAVFLFVLAIGDYMFQKYRFLEQMKMTKQEVKDEFKDTEGDPLIRGRIRRIQRELARKRMMAEVPKADVIITNPTHYAVALSYKMASMEAPVLVAKGVGYLALKIKDLARLHDVPIVENKVLAQTLYKTVDLGQFIPASLYKAVAEILAYVYKARSAWKQ